VKVALDKLKIKPNLALYSGPVYKRVNSTKLTDDDRVEISNGHLKELLSMGTTDKTKDCDSNGEPT
jgi:hypothetical protein